MHGIAGITVGAGVIPALPRRSIAWDADRRLDMSCCPRETSPRSFHSPRSIPQVARCREVALRAALPAPRRPGVIHGVTPPGSVLIPSFSLSSPFTALACFYGFPCCDASLRYEGCFFSGAGLPKLASKQAGTEEETKGAALASQQGVFFVFVKEICSAVHVRPLRGLSTLSSCIPQVAPECGFRKLQPHSSDDLGSFMVRPLRGRYDPRH